MEDKGKSECHIRLKYDNLLKSVDTLSYNIACMEKALDKPHEDATEEWFTRCEIARTKTILQLETLSKAIAEVCEKDIRKRDRLVSKQIEATERGIKHQEAMAEALRLKVERDKLRLENAEKLERYQEAKRSMREDNEGRRDANDQRRNLANTKQEAFYQEFKRLIKDRMGVDAYLDVVKDVNASVSHLPEEANQRGVSGCDIIPLDKFPKLVY